MNGFAVLQKDLVRPTPDQFKRVFKPFNHLTEADAIRMAIGTYGIIMKNVGPDMAREIQTAFQNEGIPVAIVADSELPTPPRAKQLRRIGIEPENFIVYDQLGRSTNIPWTDVALIAAGGVRHFEISKVETARPGLRFDSLTGLPKDKVTDVVHRVESGTQLLLEILLTGNQARYQIDAGGFPFKYLIDQPALSLEEKFIWLVRQICEHAPQAMLNAGARNLNEGTDLPAYPNQQALMDEMIWLLWRQASQQTSDNESAINP